MERKTKQQYSSMITRFADRLDALAVASLSSLGRGSEVEPKTFRRKFISRGVGSNVCALDGKLGKWHGEGEEVA